MADVPVYDAEIVARLKHKLYQRRVANAVAALGWMALFFVYLLALSNGWLVRLGIPTAAAFDHLHDLLTIWMFGHAVLLYLVTFHFKSSKARRGGGITGRLHLGLHLGRRKGPWG
ncbi:MAG: hypothetical protein WCD42_02895 [Rhizomicrobium sp.]